MKRRAGIIAAVLVSAVVLTGCGDKNKEFLKDIKASDYVTLGNYMGVEASAQMPSVQDEMVDYYIQQQYLAPQAVQEDVTDRAIETGDTAHIDFVGYQDGEAFEGGTGSTDLVIGSGQFIPGFEEGLIGVNAGEQVSLDLNFPDPYQPNPDLSGAPVVFEVTVHSISKETLPELTDEFVKSLEVGGCQTVQELKDWVYNLFMQEAQAQFSNEIEMILSDKILAGCTFKKEMPEALVNRYQQSISASMTMRASSYGMQLADFMQMQGYDEAGYREEFRKAATEMAQRYVMYQAIADIEGLVPAEEEVQQEIDSMVKIYGYASEEELLQQESRENISEDLMRKNVVAFLMENGNIQKTESSEE